jgi:hypothetical protein
LLGHAVREADEIDVVVEFGTRLGGAQLVHERPPCRRPGSRCARGR